MKQFGKYSEEQWAAMLDAMREEKFGGERIVEELEPLIKEFFCSDTRMRDGGLELSFRTGRNFYLWRTKLSNV